MSELTAHIVQKAIDYESHVEDIEASECSDEKADMLYDAVDTVNAALMDESVPAQLRGAEIQFDDDGGNTLVLFSPSKVVLEATDEDEEVSGSEITPLCLCTDVFGDASMFADEDNTTQRMAEFLLYQVITLLIKQ